MIYKTNTLSTSACLSVSGLLFRSFPTLPNTRWRSVYVLLRDCENRSNCPTSEIVLSHCIITEWTAYSFVDTYIIPLYEHIINHYNMHYTFTNDPSKLYAWWYESYCYMWCPSFAERLSDFVVTVSNISFPVTSVELVPPAFTLCGQYQGYPGPSQTGTVTCSPGPSRGRYVFISLPTLGVLTMCETRVFAGRSTDNLKVHRHRSHVQC